MLQAPVVKGKKQRIADHGEADESHRRHSRSIRIIASEGPAHASVKDIPHGRGVLVQVLRVGVDGTDKEINAAEYGQAPPGDGFLVIGHECFGVWSKSVIRFLNLRLAMLWFRRSAGLATPSMIASGNTT